jgi:hypothetical protein
MPGVQPSQITVSFALLRSQCLDLPMISGGKTVKARHSPLDDQEKLDGSGRM